MLFRSASAVWAMPFGHGKKFLANAPRPVDLMITDDARLLPLSIEVSVAYLPLVVELAKSCDNASACSW